MIITSVSRHCQMPPRGGWELPPVEKHCPIYTLILYNSHSMSQIFQWDGEPLFKFPPKGQAQIILAHWEINLKTDSMIGPSSTSPQHPQSLHMHSSELLSLPPVIHLSLTQWPLINPSSDSLNLNLKVSVNQKSICQLCITSPIIEL